MPSDPERQRQYLKRLYDARLAEGLCVRCGGDKVGEFRDCRACRVKRSQWERRRISHTPAPTGVSSTVADT